MNKYSLNKDIIENILENSKILIDNPRLDPYLCRVLTTELLFGTGNLKGQSKPVTCVLGYKEKFEQELGDTNLLPTTSNTKTGRFYKFLF